MGPPDGVVFTQVSSYGDNACGLDEDGIPYCWGAGDLAGNRSPPYQDIAVGHRFACAITSQGGVECWGAGWLAAENVDTSSTTAVSIDAGHERACIITDNGAGLCFYADGVTGGRFFPQCD